MYLIGSQLAVLLSNMMNELRHLQQYTNIVAKQSIKDVHFCLDISGSMRGERLANCKFAMRNIIDQHMKPRDKITYVKFDHQVHNTSIVSCTKEKDYYNICREIDNTQTIGGTAFYDALLYMINAAENVPGQ